MSEPALRHAESDLEVAACFPVMTLLRPTLIDADELVRRAGRQRNSGYRILAAWRDCTPVALAGYRIEENLIHSKFIYVDDLVTIESERHGGIGARLLDAVVEYGREEGCHRLVLDTALDNVLAHRFYYRQGLLVRALRFSRPIEHCGGDCGDTPPAQRNFLTSYVRIVFGTLGIRAVEFIQLEGMSRGPEAVTLSPDRASGWIGQRLAGIVCGAALPGGRRPGQ
jgi:ribosomal protein S18 acetylase RimI-like enzyme